MANRIAQLENVHTIAKKKFTLVYPSNLSGPIILKSKIFQNLAKKISTHIDVSNTSIQLLNKEELIDLLYEVHIHSAVCIFENIEDINLETIHQYTKSLFRRKNADYGDAFAIYGPIGVLIRMQDKISRYINLYTSTTIEVHDESLVDTLYDLNNYSAMAIMLLYEKK